MRSKAFFVNGGYGRVVSSIPAFELYEKESGDEDFIIICEGGTDAFKGHPSLDDRTYDVWHKKLFEDKIKDKDVVTTEPYRIWEYYNQKCSIAQAFDIAINGKGLREIPKPEIYLSNQEMIDGQGIIDEVKKKLKKDKVIIIQPFGRGIGEHNGQLTDPSARSIRLPDLKEIVKKLQKEEFAVIMMSEFKFDFKSKSDLKDEFAIPEGVGLRQWAAAIKLADHFLGCDSVGQHLAAAVGTESTIVLGSTFPVNVSYPDNDLFEVVDLGMHSRVYDPIRITIDESKTRKNENLITMNKEIIQYVVKRVLRTPKDEEENNGE